MSTKTLEKPAKNPPKEVAKKTTTLGHKTVVDFVKALKGTQEDTDVAKILGISIERREELNGWVDCEGTNLQSIQNFTADLKNVEEVAYCFYYLGILNTRAEEQQ
jgi:hypothetical protein